MPGKPPIFWSDSISGGGLSVKFISRPANISIIPPREGGVSFMAKDKKQDKKQDKKAEKVQDKAKKN
jgi:hypothetical protein